MSEPLHILHYNTASLWRGSEQQGLYLIQQLNKFPVVQYAVGQPDRLFLDTVAPYVNGTFSLRTRGEFNPLAVLRLREIIKRYKIDIVHTHTTAAHAIALQAKYLYPKFKLVVHRRVDFAIKNNPISLFKYRSDKVDRILCVSKFVKDVLVWQSVPREKTIVIYSGVDPGKFRHPDPVMVERMRRQYRITDYTVVLLNIAALTAHKDHRTLIEAMKFLSAKQIKFKLIIIGEGEQREFLEKRIETLKLSDQIVLAGYRSDLDNFFSLATMVVHSSQDEGLGTVILDALANGKPVVATNAGGIPEILGQNEYGVLVPRLNPKALALGIFNLLQNKDQMENYCRVSVKRVQEFSIQNMAEQTFSVYQNLGS